MRRDEINIATITVGYICFITLIVLAFIRYEDYLSNNIIIALCSLSLVEVLCSIIYVSIKIYRLPIILFIGVVYVNLIVIFTVLAILQYNHSLVIGFYIVNLLTFTYWFYVFISYISVLLKEDCCICFEECNLQSIVVLYCGHSYHKDCIERWFSENETCPYCRS